MIYKGTMEEQLYLTSVKREKDAFHYLINEKSVSSAGYHVLFYINLLFKLLPLLSHLLSCFTDFFILYTLFNN